VLRELPAERQTTRWLRLGSSAVRFKAITNEPLATFYYGNIINISKNFVWAGPFIWRGCEGWAYIGGGGIQLESVLVEMFTDINNAVCYSEVPTSLTRKTEAFDGKQMALRFYLPHPPLRRYEMLRPAQRLSSCGLSAECGSSWQKEQGRAKSQLTQ
jgi:hypothetical protein